MKSTRLLFERLGLVLITVLALGVPLALGFFGWLALGDGLDWKPSDPLSAGRIWLVRENRRFTALAVSGKLAVDPAVDAPGAQCARTYFIALHWTPKITFERTLGTCSCYASVDGALRETSTLCAVNADPPNTPPAN